MQPISFLTLHSCARPSMIPAVVEKDEAYTKAVPMGHRQESLNACQEVGRAGVICHVVHEDAECCEADG